MIHVETGSSSWSAWDRLPCGLSAHASIIPGAIPQKAEQPSLHALAFLWVAGRTSSDGLYALALAVPYDAVCV